MNELRDAGPVEVARLEEPRGGTAKFYRANTIVPSYGLPEGADERIDEMAATVAPEMIDLVDRLRSEFGDEFDDIAAEMSPCEHCDTQKYETVLLSTVLRRAFVDTL